MTFFGKSIFAIHKNLLFVLGFWPTPTDKSRLLRIIVIYGMCLSNITMQTLWMFEFECDLNCVLYVLAILLQSGMGFIKYRVHHGNMMAIQSCFTDMDLDWEFVSNDKVSVEILQRYAGIARITTIVFIAFINVYSVSLLPLLLFGAPSLLPNHTCTQFWERPVAMKEPNLQVCKSPPLILGGTAYMNLLIIITGETTFLMFSEHVCAMFKLAGYHLKHATVKNVYAKSLLALHIHMRALKFKCKVWDTFGHSYTVLVAFGVLSASASIMSFRQLLKTWNDLRILTLLFTFMTSVLLYATMSMYYGQRVIDHSLGVFYDAYDSQWYKFPLEAQKFYFIVMERSIRSCSYSERGFFVSSLEGLTSVLSASFSYAAVFFSVQN